MSIVPRLRSLAIEECKQKAVLFPKKPCSKSKYAKASLIMP
jgi:hypothetical protein